MSFSLRSLRDLAEMRRADGLIAAEQFGRRFGEPGVRPLLAKALGHRAHALRREQRLALLVVETGIGKPQARWRLMHQSGRDSSMPCEPRLAPGGDEIDRRSRRPPCARSRSDVGCARLAVRDERLIHRDEPLLGRAEDDRRLAAPVVRIAVQDVLRRKQPLAASQLLGDQRVAFLRRLRRE